jgi:hypothetical protein
MMRARIAVALALAIAAAAPAHASTRRIAVIVGNNAGNADQVPLHFAETDAARFAQVLGELGGVAPGDRFVLQGKSLAALTEIFAQVRRQIVGLRADPANRVVVLFYFSGHSDGEALELGRDRLTFSELRRQLASLGADVRVALIDSCKSGALLAVKGGKPGPGFQIRMTDELASTGEALLTSSAADEVALESREIAGSFFTHHLISGLRGAADASGDGHRAGRGHEARWQDRGARRARCLARPRRAAMNAAERAALPGRSGRASATRHAARRDAATSA